MTIGLVVLFFEGSLVKLLQTERTDKVFRMELPKHGCDTSPHDWFMACSTQRTPFEMVVGLTIRLPFEIEERSSNEGTSAFIADEAVRMPLAIQSRDVVLCDGMVASSTLR